MDVVRFKVEAKRQDRLCGLQNLLFNGSGGYISPSVKLTTHSCLLRRFGMNGAIPPLAYAFIMCSHPPTASSFQASNAGDPARSYSLQ